MGLDIVIILLYLMSYICQAEPRIVIVKRVCVQARGRGSLTPTLSDKAALKFEAGAGGAGREPSLLSLVVSVSYPAYYPVGGGWLSNTSGGIGLWQGRM